MFHKVDQTIFGNKDGNCYQACLSSVLGMDLNDVPHVFTEGVGIEGYYYIDKFLNAIGKDTFEAKHDDLPENLKVSPYIVIGDSPRGGCHAVVYQYGKIIHDPHPSRLGVTGDLVAHIIITN